MKAIDLHGNSVEIIKTEQLPTVYMDNKYKFGIGLMILVALTGVATAQTNSSQVSECQVVEAQDAEASSGNETVVLEREDVVQPDTAVSTGEQGYMVLACDIGFREVPSSTEGNLSEVVQATDEFENDIPQIEQEVDIEEALNETDRIENNLQQINQVVDETVPDPIASIIFGDKVNFQVNDTTIGISTNDTGVQDVKENGYEEPTLEIKTDEETLKEITSSQVGPENFREAYHGDGITVEAHSVKNKVVFGVVNTTSKIYGFINNF